MPIATLGTKSRLVFALLDVYSTILIKFRKLGSLLCSSGCDKPFSNIFVNFTNVCMLWNRNPMTKETKIKRIECMEAFVKSHIFNWTNLFFCFFFFVNFLPFLLECLLFECLWFDSNERLFNTIDAPIIGTCLAR